jgi:hypothetical protein
VSFPEKQLPVSAFFLSLSNLTMLVFAKENALDPSYAALSEDSTL